MKEKQAYRSSTYHLAGGGFVHIDRYILPIIARGRLGAVPPLAPNEIGPDEKRPIAEAPRKRRKP